MGVPIVIQGKVETPAGFVEISSVDWLNWLSQHKSFRYEPQSEYSGFTVRAEKGGYWYSYRKVAGELRKEYIGKPENLTIERLEEVARQLEQPTQPHQKVIQPEVTEKEVTQPKVTEKEVTQPKVTENYEVREDIARLWQALETLRDEVRALGKLKAR
jgi:hypothetical protein